MKREESRIITVNGRSITLTHESRVMFPGGITKGDLLAYYQSIAPFMLAHIKNHLLVMQRFPEGIMHEGFYQKDAGDYFPSWIKRMVVPKDAGGTVEYVVCKDAATVVYLANQGCITVHSWLSKFDKLNFPDRMIFDLDPSGDDFSVVRVAALQIQELLEYIGLHPYVMTTGSRGLHLVVSLKRLHTFEFVRAFAKDCALLMVHYDPSSYTIAMRKEKREGRLFIDYFRNAFGQTGVAPYSVRPKPRAPVALPIAWHEVEEGDVDPQKYTIKNALARVTAHGDPWADMAKKAVNLKKPRERLDELLRAIK